MQLSWIKCQGNVWCNLNTVNLDSAHFNNMEGVYVIWHVGNNPAVVYVGQGKIKDRIAEHRKDPRIQRYQSLGLYATWASVDNSSRDGVERFLYDLWRPLIGDRRPNAIPIQVNLPWN